jgi:hypothetical protein
MRGFHGIRGLFPLLYTNTSTNIFLDIIYVKKNPPNYARCLAFFD